jgi:hypothetical protein
MKSFIGYILRGRIHAMGMVGLFGALGWIFPPLSYFSGAAVGLVTLRKGAQDGLVIIGGAALLCGLIAWGGIGTPWFALPLVLVLWLPVWLGSQVLRFTRSQGLMLVAVGAMAALFALGMRVMIGDVEAWWYAVLQRFFEPSAAETGLPFGEAELKAAASMMNGFAAAALGMSVVLPILLARWWQSVLYNPGGFGAEFRELRLPRVVALPVALAAVFVTIQLISNGSQGVVSDLLMVAMALYLFQGLAIAHYYIHQRGASMGRIVLLYIGLIILQPYSALALAMVGLVDSGMDLRRLGQSGR